MKFVEVERLPETRRQYKSLKNMFDEFLNMNVKMAKVDLTEHDYKNISIGYRVLYNSVKRWDVPIKVCMRNGEVYFVRRDI